MTVITVLPADFSFVQITDGTNNAIVSGLDNSVGVYIGSTAPDGNSVTHMLSDTEITVSSPAVLYLRLLRKQPAGSKPKSVVVSTW